VETVVSEVQEVAISEVERELTRLWREAAQSAQSPSSAAGGKRQGPLMRACALNLVVAGCDGERPDVAQIVSQITARHPSRAILLQSDDETTPGSSRPRAWVSMVCHAGARGQPQVCSELLVLAAPPAALHELVAAVAGLLVADLPTVLWWQGRPPEAGVEEERFDHLADVADRMLFDSLRWNNAQLARSSVLARAYPRLPFGDLNWARLTPWRASIALCFDTPAAQQMLAVLQKARIFSSRSGAAGQGDEAAQTRATAPSAALLLCGWLRSRLRASLPAEFVAGEADLVELHASGASFRVARPPDAGDAAALVEELRLLGRDPVFEQALESALGSVTNSREARNGQTLYP